MQPIQSPNDLSASPACRLPNDLLQRLRDPRDGSQLRSWAEGNLSFAGGNSYPTVHGIPILLDEESSLFSIEDVQAKTPTTQSHDYRDRSHLKNFVRQRLLPPLSNDATSAARYRRLSTSMGSGPVLILGAGDKSEAYRKSFPGVPLVNTDVHAQFGADLVCDGHRIPFAKDTFALVLVPQVLEHVARPWIVAEEIERVAKPGGLIQIEVPFSFPFHGAPYDFYRFTPSALRFLFPRCQLSHLETPEGNWSGAAVAISNAMVESFSNRYLRIAAVAVSRSLLWWMKYLDPWSRGGAHTMPKGFAATYTFDGKLRTEKEMMARQAEQHLFP